MTTAAVSYPLAKERNLILGSLLLLAAIAWAVLVWQSGEVDDHDMSVSGGQPMTEGQMSSEQVTMSGEGMGEDGSHMGLTMEMSSVLFVGLWGAMMVAIMFPTAAPMILTFARIQGKRKQRGQLFVPTWLFVGSYIALWSATGVLAYAAALGGDALAESWSWLMDNAGRVGGVVLVSAGVYQFTPLKRACLAKCRTPMAFILGSWRDGNAGAVRMGFEHGAYCMGCCWMLFVILFPLGMMNVAAMAVITAVIFAEKSFTAGARIAQGAAVVLIVYGSVCIAIPDALPTMI